MTLMAFHAQEKQVDILTDSWGYTRAVRSMSRHSKVMLIPHMDAAVTSKGDSLFTDTWKSIALGASSECATFDELIRESPAWLQATWENTTAGRPYVVEPSIVAHLGWSDDEERFIAVGFASDEDWQPFRVEGLFVHPTPHGVRPSPFERRRLAEHLPQVTRDAQEALAVIDSWADPVPPQDVDGWARLGLATRLTRAMAPVESGMKVLVGGELYLTTVTRGAALTRRLLTFDDSGEEFAQVVAGTMHPVAQMGPCPLCESGEPFADCCLQLFMDDPCQCGSGRPLRQCCSIYAAA